MTKHKLILLILITFNTSALASDRDEIQDMRILNALQACRAVPQRLLKYSNEKMILTAPETPRFHQITPLVTIPEDAILTLPLSFEVETNAAQQPAFAPHYEKN